ncbi:MAG TPA: hypothetical protein VFQ53_03250 [Kofleriaceae bacterium]|nr:hypothetical protein [Kofleriaceae bacterium]
MKRAVIAVVLAACGGSSSTPADAPPAIDAAIDGGGGLPSTCEGACMTTAITATLAATRTLNHAVYGVTAATNELHVEVHLGGAAGCPTETSPTPDYTLVLGTVPIPTTTAPLTSSGNILDFVGDLLGGPLGAPARSVVITPVAGSAITSSTGSVALDVMLTFDAGTVSGHLFALHCASLDS